MSLDHLDRFPQLRSLRVSCMPAPHVGFASDALWRLVVPTAITRLRYQFLNVSEQPTSSFTGFTLWKSSDRATGWSRT